MSIAVEQSKSTVHSIRFRKDLWTTTKARQWLHSHDFKPIKKVDVGLNYYRYRIIEPNLFKSFITKKYDNGINIVIGYYK